MTFIETLENRNEALNVQEVAKLLGVSDKQIYVMVADGRLPAFHIGRAIRFDPQDLADWLRKKRPPSVQDGPRKLQKDKSLTSDRNEKEGTSQDHIWRNKVNCLEAAFAIDSSSSDPTTENS